MKKTLFLLIALVLTLGSSLKAQTQDICPDTKIPAGWVVISSRSCAGCCNSGNGVVQMQTIKKIDNLPAGTTLEICPGPTPAGWVVVSTRACSGCCGGSGVVQMPTIKRIDNLPAGTTIEICPGTIPKGWTVVSTRTCSGCCGATGDAQVPTIKKQ